MSDRVIVWPSGRAPTLEEIEAELGRWDLADPDRAIENRTYWEYREAVGRVAEDLARWRVVFDPFDPDASLDPDLPLTLAAWSVARLDNGYTVSTVQSHLSAVGWWGATQLAHPAADVHRHAGLVVKAWAVENPRPVRGAGPVPRAWLAAMADAMAADGSPTALRDLVLLTWNLAGGLRPGEPGTVAVDDLTSRPGEIGWTFARSKGNPLGGRRDDQVILRQVPGDVLCPIAAWDRWREVWPHTGPDMPAIPSFIRGGGGGGARLPNPAADDVLGVSEQAVNRMLARWAERAGVPAPTLVTGHALRHSAATFAILGGATEYDVRRLLRHAHVATTRRYIARLGPWVGADEARRVLVGDHPDGLEALGVERRAARRPAGRVRLGRRADRLAEAADLAAAGPMPPGTRRTVEDELRLWDEFCVEFGVDPTAPSATDVRLWFGWRMRRAQATAHPLKAAGVPMKPGSARRALWCLERGLATRGVPAGTVTGEAGACWRGYARQVAGLVAPPESAVEYPLGELAALATAAGTFDPDDVARWAVGLAALALHPLDAGRPGGDGFRPVPPSAVTDPGDGTRIVTVGGFDPVVVRPGPKPPLDPVAALDHLAAVTPADAPTIFTPTVLDRAKNVLRGEGSGSAARLAAAGPEVVERAMWRLAAPLVARVQDQAAVAFLTAGALRFDDLRRLRRDTSPEWRVWASGSSWASHLAGSKGNPAEGEIVWVDGELVAGHPALDPAANLARLVAWTPWATGPAIGAITGVQSWAALLDPSTPPRPMPYVTLRCRLVAAAQRAGLRPGLSLHSFRQSAATAAWWHNKDRGMSDADNFRSLMRRLRHVKPDSTLAYVTAADPGVSITADVHLDLDPLEVPDAALGTPYPVPVTAAA
ncbi:MAG: tyrosine-type recombinase/integrase [Acidimicrobiales bacterium]|nr:tyrosine-type recombinase/integrase [Acidimicrobiales bacterium]